MSLKTKLVAHINENGPMRLDEYFTRCLWDAELGYYANREVFGAAGDFVTAPEISQIFGELIGLWCVQTWHDLGAPDAFTLLEMGAGRGVMMHDILRVTRQFTDFAAAAKIHILEKSERLRDIQAQALESVTHIGDLIALPPRPTIILANEFFDALPIRQFRFEDAGWIEAYVDVNMRPIWRPCANPPKTAASHLSTGVIEISEASEAIAALLGLHISTHGGAALIIDYGALTGTGDSFQAVRSHQFSDTFAGQGHADLTAHVRFEDIADASNLPHQFTTQGTFLNTLGGVERLAALTTKNPSLASELSTGYHRLVNEEEMGKLFKVMALRAPNAQKLAGFPNDG